MGDRCLGSRRVTELVEVRRVVMMGRSLEPAGCLAIEMSPALVMVGERPDRVTRLRSKSCSRVSGDSVRVATARSRRGSAGEAGMS